MRFVVVIKERCRPDKCGLECVKYCPVARAGKEIFKIDKFATVDESLCIGCGICVHKCPFGAIKIVNKPEELGEIFHRYLPNGFALFGFIEPEKNLGILGRNGTGKSTLLKILSGKILPNFGGRILNGDKTKILEEIPKKSLVEFLSKVYEGEMRISFKPQMVSRLVKTFSGTVEKLLTAVDERGLRKEIAEELEILPILHRKLNELSGGELQRVAIAAALLRDADFYFFDEPSSYLDIRHRLIAARVISEFAENRIVVEHDLLMLDYLVEKLHILYGLPSVYGIISMKKSARTGINEFLEGYLKAENMVIRDAPLKFRRTSEARNFEGMEKSVETSGIKVKRGEFILNVEPLAIAIGEVVGILGRNGLGKTTFAEVLAGKIEATEGEIKRPEKASMKPQYIEELAKDVEVVKLLDSLGIKKNDPLLAELEILPILHRKLNELSGGELQRVAIAAALLRDAQLYILDEPSAFLDVEQRLKIAKLIRNFAELEGKTIVVIDHDIMVLDYISDSILLFSGTPGVRGTARHFSNKKDAIKEFLKEIGITLRRDVDTKRLRINKEGSQKDVYLRSTDTWIED